MMALIISLMLLLYNDNNYYYNKLERKERKRTTTSKYATQGIKEDLKMNTLYLWMTRKYLMNIFEFLSNRLWSTKKNR